MHATLTIMRCCMQGSVDLIWSDLTLPANSQIGSGEATGTLYVLMSSFVLPLLSSLPSLSSISCLCLISRLNQPPHGLYAVRGIHTHTIASHLLYPCLLDPLTWLLFGVFFVLLFSSYYMSMVAGGMTSESAAYFGPSLIAAFHGLITSVFGIIFMLSSQYRLNGMGEGKMISSRSRLLGRTLVPRLLPAYQGIGT